jgi:hypothetical protein
MPTGILIPGTLHRIVLVGLFVSIGCRGDGLSDYQRSENARLTVMEKIQGQGVKLKEKNLDVPAYAVDMRGMTVTDELIDQLGELQNITELDLSKSTITDEQLGKLYSTNLCVRCFKLDLSHTGITDAGLDKMANLGVLSELNVAGTKVTKAGTERLKKRKLDDKRIPDFLRKPPRVQF